MERQDQTLSENVQIRDALDPPNAFLNASVKKMEDQLKALTARFEKNIGNLKFGDLFILIPSTVNNWNYFLLKIKSYN